MKSLNCIRSLAIFDLDGTLADTREDLCTGINLMRKHFNAPPLPLEVVTSYIGDGIKMLVERSLQDIVEKPSIEEAVKLNYKFYREHIVDKTKLYTGVFEGLSNLKENGFCFALITNKPYEAALYILKYFNIEPFFDVIIGGDSGFALKPSPQSIFHSVETINKKYNVSLFVSEDCWIIGDNHTDIAAAKNANAKSIFVTYGFGKLLDIKPDVICSSFDEIVSYLLNLSNKD